MVADVKDNIADSLAEAQVYVPCTVVGGQWNNLLIRSVADPAGLLGPLRSALASIDKEAGIEEESAALHDFIENNFFIEPRFVLGTLAGFALLEMALVCVGVYSVLSYSVSRRTHEIGVRMALGAEATDVRSWVMKAGLRWLLVGIGIGVAASIALAKILQNRIWGIKSADPLTLAAVCLLLTAVGLAACYFPARRATKVDPMVALRYE